MKASAKLNHIPRAWRGIYIHFIPKQGKPSYDNSKSFRPISLMSFILKTMEKLIDKEIRETFIARAPLSKHQHAYQKGKGTESALHYITNEIEQFSSKGNTTMVTFIDIAGAFDNTNYEIIEEALLIKKVDQWIINWIGKMLKSRVVEAANEENSITYNPTRGCPQGGCLSPLLWSIVIDVLLHRLDSPNSNELTRKFKLSAYADDVAIIVNGKTDNIKEISTQMNRALKITEKWCIETGLEVSPEKSNYMVITKANRNLVYDEIKIFGKPIPIAREFKYLGVYFDHKNNWSTQVSRSAEKGLRALFATKSMVTTHWGLTPKVMSWIYNCIVIPRIYYGCLTWWHSLKKECNRKKLDKVNRMALMMITGATRSSPTKALEALTNTIPIEIKAEELALKATIRLIGSNTWIVGGTNKGHKKLEEEARSINDGCYSDFTNPKWNECKKFTVKINERNNWSYGINFKNNQYIWYTDASRDENYTSIAWYNEKLNISKYFKVSKVKITRSELLAIEECAKDIINQRLRNQNIVIATDSTTSLRALDSLMINKKSVQSCIDVLNKLGDGNKLTLIWTPAHSRIRGNDKADILARKGLKNTQLEYELELENKTIDETIKDRSKKIVRTQWNITGNKMKHAKKYIEGFNDERAKELLKSSRKEIRVITGILTGHGITRSYLKQIGKAADDKCRYCKDGRETMRHWLEECLYLKIKMDRLKRKSNAEIRNNKYRDIILMSKETGLYETFFKEIEREDHNHVT